MEAGVRDAGSGIALAVRMRRLRHPERTLAVVDCYATPQPDSSSRYSGTYPGAP